ncbi:hypothetical protein KQ945_12565 [Bacillus subtilis subsp. subtilis]|nr:hypothetical protein [Bacillus subtilis subsp. subtilis]
MKIIYRYTFAWQAARGKQLARIGVRFQAPTPSVLGGGIAVCHVEEGAPEWLQVSGLIRAWGGGIWVETEFSASDIANAAFCALRLTHANGYPQPEDDFLYREQTYDTSSYCPRCGTGLVQKAPFRVRRSLKWGRNSFLKLFWVDDVFLAQRAAWKRCLAPLGVEILPVQDVKGIELDEVVQLRADDQMPLVMNDIDGEVCGVCGRERFRWHERGFFPSPLGCPAAPIFRSGQYFGSDHQSSREIIVSAGVVKSIQAAGLKGVAFWPCAPSG